jgi:hypothetical protein
MNMAYENDHPLIAEAKSLVLNGEEFFSKDNIVQRFARLNPDQRVQMLRGARMALDADASLRKKAQLMSINRALEQTHRALLAAER